MTHCASCGRALKRDPIMVDHLPMGPVCATKAPPPFQGPDLLGFDTAAAAALAETRLEGWLWNRVRTEKREIAHDFAASRGRLGLQ